MDVQKWRRDNLINELLGKYGSLPTSIRTRCQMLCSMRLQCIVVVVVDVEDFGHGFHPPL